MTGAPAFEPAGAVALEAEDPLPSLRGEFVVPPWPEGRHREWAYFAGNSLGLMPLAAREAVEQRLADWGRLAVEGWFDDPRPWLEDAGVLSEPVGRLVGAAADDVAVCNSLTVNLHLLLASFYRPGQGRDRLLVERGAFPSDAYAVVSHAALHGLDARDAVVVADTPAILETIEREGERLALVLLGAVNYLTGELLDVPAVTAAARAVGAVVGWDLAHAIGNVPLALHDCDADFAVWCHYKYVNGGPGAPGGLFLHERHGSDLERFRLAGWWGTDPEARFRMDPEFVPRRGAEGWVVSTPPVIAFAPLAPALEQFSRVGIGALRARSRRLTAYLEGLLDVVAERHDVRQLTPRDPERRGAQLSLTVQRAAAVARRLRSEHGVVCDVRRPDVIRLAPAPLYTTYEDCRRAAEALLDVLPER
jgi:kynureninase